MNSIQLARICQHHQALLISAGPDRMQVAAPEPVPEGLLRALRFASRLPIDLELWPQERLETQRLKAPEAEMQASGDTIAALEMLLNQAIARRASDIHLEPGREQCQLRLRTDGRLHTLAPLSHELAQAITARLKILAGLDIAERRMPQDGQFGCDIAGTFRSFRLSTLPCLHGETLVLRLLTHERQTLAPDELGMSDAQTAMLCRALSQPQGLILVTGPTGSGKTMTLYSALNYLNKPDRNLCSVEDPVEIPLPGLNQTQINPKAGLDFQRVLRALLRQDPDVIMVGEIRDSETATIAMNAAQTGHLVLSTLHTNSTAETITRLGQMAIPVWMSAAALKLIIAQRLVRKLCPHCCQRQPQDLQLPDYTGGAALPDWHAPGCEQCDSGYYGRLALFELMPISHALRDAIIGNYSASQLSDVASAEGMQTLWQSGLMAVRQGLTSLAEVCRVTGVAVGHA